MPDGVSASISIGQGLLGNSSYLAFDDPGEYAEVNNLLINLSLPRVEIVVRVGGHDVVDDSIKLSFESCVWRTSQAECPEVDGSALVELDVLKMEAAQGDHYHFECTRHSDVPSTLNIPILFDCTITAGDAIRTNSLVVREVTSSLDSVDGWEVEYLNADGSDLEFPAEPPSNTSGHATRLIGGQSFHFSVRLTPTACAAGDASDLEVYARIKPMAAAFTLGSDSVGKTPEMPTGFAVPDIEFTNQRISITPNPVAVKYSLTEQAIPGQTEQPELQIQYSVSGCGAWNRSIQMGPFVKTGDLEYHGPVPLVTGVTHNGDVLDQDALSEGLVLDSGSDPGEELHSFDHSFNLEYTIPANTPVGEYTSTFTVTTSAGPD